MPLLSKNPFSLRYVYLLLNHSLIKSTVLQRPRAGRDKRLIDYDSIDKFFGEEFHRQMARHGPTERSVYQAVASQEGSARQAESHRSGLASSAAHTPPREFVSDL